MAPTVAVLLSAGESERMGAPKALLELGQQSFLERIAGALAAPCGPASIAGLCVVVGGSHAQVVAAAVADVALKIPVALWTVTNPAPEGGPISSLRCGLASAESRHPDTAVLVHPVDIPGVAAADVTAILEAASSDSDADAVIPSIGRRRGHPVWLSPTSVAQVRALAPDETLRDYLARDDLAIRYVERDNELLRYDVDTPDAYEAIVALWAQRRES